MTQIQRVDYVRSMDREHLAAYLENVHILIDLTKEDKKELIELCEYRLKRKNVSDALVVKADFS